MKSTPMKPAQFKAARDALGWTNVQIADTLGIAERTLYRHAAGGTMPEQEFERDLEDYGQATRDPAQRKGQRELFRGEPFPFFDKLTVHGRGGGASAAKGQVGVAYENDGDLCECRHGTAPRCRGGSRECP
jgi:hypothetical protein